MAFAVNKRVQQQLLQDLALSPAELDRRERNRSKVRRSYYRKIFNLSGLRAQVDALEAEYARLLAALDVDSASDDASDAAASGNDDAAATDAAATDAAATDLARLSLARQALYAENEALRGKQMAFAKAAASLQHLLDARAGEEDPARDGERALARPQLARGFSVEECMAAGREGFSRVAAYLDAQRSVPPPRSAMGWADRRAYSDAGELRFCFSKHFAHRAAAQLSAATWALVTSPRRAQKLYSHWLHVSLRVVQTPDVNNVVCLRTVRPAGQDARVASLFLLSRFETDRGLIVLARGLDPSRLAGDALGALGAPAQRECWQDEFTWMLAEDDADGCRFSFGGEMRAAEPHNLFWGVEVLLMVLRWETETVAPLFTLRCNSG